jgi:hypothetical protein
VVALNSNAFYEDARLKLRILIRLKRFDECEPALQRRARALCTPSGDGGWTMAFDKWWISLTTRLSSRLLCKLLQIIVPPAIPSNLARSRLVDYSAHHDGMLEQQLDLFSASGIPAEQPLPQNLALRPAVVGLDEEALIAAIPAANLGDCTALAAEAARRRLAAAIPALEALCRRFVGFGIDRVVPEQSAALRALAVIGSRDAAQAVSRLIVRRVVQGPALVS